MNSIPFNKPHLTGKEIEYIYEAVYNGHISGNGQFTKKCQKFFEDKFGFKKCLLTTSCTDALEMAAILIGIQPGDEVIMPSYTFVSTANAFVMHGAKIVFADCEEKIPNINANQIEGLINSKTKAIVVVHYAGISCEMDSIVEIVKKYNLFLIEDAAQAIDSCYKNKPLGSFGHLAAFSFHETKNIISGEGGMLVINEEKFMTRAEVIWEKGTNRAAFFRGEVDKYGWVDIGSSFLPSELISAFLYAQLENLVIIQNIRKKIWETYFSNLKHLEESGHINLPYIPSYATNNGHMFYIVCKNLHERTQLIDYLKEKGIHAIFHYQALHLSEYYKQKHDGRFLPNCVRFVNQLLRLPLYFELKEVQIVEICRQIDKFYD